jgi:pimeloyl-ACP methyl ester carboxylesterase
LGLVSGMLGARVNGLEIAYQRAGDGPPLVLLHGFIIDSRIWRQQVDGLSRDFDVIAWDAPGSGKSSDPGEHFSMTKYADCLAKVLAGIGVDSAHVCGQSWGGILALEFYRCHPGAVKSLIFADAYAGWSGSLGKEEADHRLEQCLRQSEIAAEQWVPEFARGAVSDSCPDTVREEVVSIASDFHPVGFRAMSRGSYPDRRNLLPTIGVPTLLLWGDDDKRSPLRVAEQFGSAIPGGRLEIIPDAGHLSNMEQPSLFNAAVRDFLRLVDLRG